MGHVQLFVMCFNISLALGAAFNLKTVERDNSFSEIIACLSNVTRTYFDRHTTYLYFDKSKDAADLFTKAVQSPKMLMYNKFTEVKVKSAFAFIAEDGIHTQLLNTTAQSYFIAVWKTVSPKINDVGKLMKHFWIYGKRINVVALMQTEHRIVNAYTYRPFSGYGCGKFGRPYLIDQWINGSFQTGADLFSYRVKTNDMHACHLKCVGNEHPPDSIMHTDGRRLFMDGAGIKVLEIVAGHMNFTPSFVTAGPYTGQTYNWHYSADVLDNITVMLNNEDVDLAFGWYSYATHNERNAELARTTSIDCFGWAVPYRAGPSPPPWTNYAYEFDGTSWAFLALIFLVVTGAFYFFGKLKQLHYGTSVMFFVFHTSIDQPLRVHATSCSMRTFLICWLWYCMVISVAYKASLGSFMTVPLHGLEFTRMNQILDSNLIAMTTPQSLRIINATMATTKISRKFMQRLQQLPPTNFEKVIDRLVIDRDIALFEVKRSIYYYSIPQARVIKVKIPIRFLPGCLLRAHTTQFMFNRGSYLTESVDDILSRLFETGIVDHWIVHLGSNKVLPLEKIKGRVLKLKRLKEAFLFLFFGYVVAFIVFLAEICWSKWNRGGNLKNILDSSRTRVSHEHDIFPFVH